MREYKDVNKVVRVITRNICDWCQQDVHREADNQTFRSIIKSEIGRADTGYAYGEGWEVQDLCLECAGRVRTLLEDAGIRVHEYTY